MTDNIKLPPMPETEWKLYMPAQQYEAAWTSTESGYTEADMENYAREAVRLNAQAAPDVGHLVNSLVAAAFRQGELWERCQGKGWPESESAEFTKLRDETIPSAIAQLQLALSAAPAAPQPAQQPLTDEQMWELWNKQGSDEMNQQEAITFARAIEQAHGIGVKP